MPAKRLLSDIVSLTPSNYDNFKRCPRLFYCNALLGLPASDLAPSADQGLQVHDMLRKIHDDGSCDDGGHVVDVLAAHGFDTPSFRDMVGQHARRCPSGAADSSAHEVDLARFHRFAPPMFMATARIDAVWIHDGILDARDYKTGGKWDEAVSDIYAAHVQAFVLAAKAKERGLRLLLRYEYLQPEVDEDPEPWELDDETLVEVEEKLRATVELMWAEEEWKGVKDADVCRTCRYRSICRDSAAPGEPAWPVLSSDPTDVDR
jgi:hypothetical protein